MIWTRPPGKNATGNTARTPLAFEQPSVAHAEHERRSRKGGDHSCCRAGHGRPLQARPGHATSCGIPPSLQAGTVGGYRSLGEPLRRMLSQDRTGWSPEQSGSGDLPHRVRADDLAPCRRDNGTSPISPPEPGGGQIKSGAPARGERVGKYNRLMEIATAAPGSASRALHPAARAPGPLLPAAQGPLSGGRAPWRRVSDAVMRPPGGGPRRGHGPIQAHARHAIRPMDPAPSLRHYRRSGRCRLRFPGPCGSHSGLAGCGGSRRAAMAMAWTIKRGHRSSRWTPVSWRRC